MDPATVAAEEAEFKVPGLIGLPAAKKANKPKEATQIDGEKEKVLENEQDISQSKPSPISKSTTDSEPSEEERRRKQEESNKKYADIMSRINYQPPPGAQPFDLRYSLEVLKTGSIIDGVKFTKDKSFYAVGRIPSCDIIAENPTVSRVHAILQFCGGGNTEASQEEGAPKATDANINSSSECKERGLYLYDLDSTHGTFLNKNQIFPRRFYRLRVGHMIKFGNSTRQYIVSGPSDDEEEESEKTVTELLKERVEKELIRKKIILSSDASAESDEKVEDTGINWGMGEDAVEETNYNVNPFAADFESSELNLDNPKKTLTGWFEREGYDLFFDVREKATGHFIVRINLPLDGPGGSAVFAEVDVKGKKKEAIVQCALKACEILDKYGVLRQSHHEGYRKKLKDWEQKDYYSSDEDTFLDRTGSIEVKRKRRMKQAGKDDQKAESFESLTEKCNSLNEEIEKLQSKIHKAEVKQESEREEEVDALDAFMQTVKSGALEIKQMRAKIKQLKDEQNHVKRLMELARPSSIPIQFSTKVEKSESSIKKTPISISTTFSSTNTKNPEALSKMNSKSSTISIKLSKPSQPEESEPNQPKKLEENVETKVEIKPPPVEPEQKPIIKRPPIFTEEDDQDQDAAQPSADEGAPKKKKKRNRALFKKEDKQIEYDANNPDYSTWVPPTDQAGDGRTKLNEKLGY